MDLLELVTRERVRDTYAAYNHAGDAFRLDELATYFAENGSLEVAGHFRAEGREEIASRLTKVSGSAAANPDFLVRHFVANLKFIDVTEQRVRTLAYFLVCHKDAPDHWGRYSDVLVPAGDQWLFESRVVTIEGARPSSRAL